MWTFTSGTIGALWVDVTRTALAEGQVNQDDQGNIYELNGVAFEIENPSSVDPIVARYGNGPRIEAMRKNFMSHEPQFGYKVSYGTRIFGTGENAGYEFVRNLLKARPETKTATLSLLRAEDFSQNHIPCIATLDFKIRDNKLQLHYFARSQDIYKKAYADNLAMYEIQKKIADDLGIGTSKLSGWIASAHIYDRDLPELESLEIFRNLRPHPPQVVSR